MSEPGQGRIKEFRAGAVRAAIWRQQREEAGLPFVGYSVKIEKRYFDEHRKEWRSTDYFFANDLPRLCLIAHRAFEFIALDESGGDGRDA